MWPPILFAKCNKSHKPISIKLYINFYGKHSHSDLSQMIQKHKCGRNSLLCALKMITAAVIITNHCLSSVWLAIICCQQELEAMRDGIPASFFLFIVFFCFNNESQHSTFSKIYYPQCTCRNWPVCLLFLPQQWCNEFVSCVSD